MSRVVLGVQCVREALRAHGKGVSSVLIESSGSPTLAALERHASGIGVAVERVSRERLDKMSGGTRHQGAAALAPELDVLEIEELIDRLPSVVLALDEVQDPQNFGAMVRSAVALAGAAVLWGEHASAPLTPATFRASAGAIEHALLCRARSLRTALSQLREAGYSVIALDGHAEVELCDVNLTGPVVVVVGSEGEGIRKPVKALASAVAKLPMTGKLDSLNASVSAAIALYEVVRQRRG